MKYIILSLILSTSVIHSQSLPEYFHTTDQVNDDITNLQSTCPQMQKTVKSHHPYIYTLTFPSESQEKAFVIFGEHARELISVETGLHFVKSLCSMDTKSLPYQITIIVNMNPSSRKYVERGHYCLRENQRGVDLNRNYDVSWRFVEDHALQISSGKAPFSEVETQIVRDTLDELKPKVFLSIHSGTLGILQPYAYKKELCSDPRLADVGYQLKINKCAQCLQGGASLEIGYMASGSSQDYAYDKAGAEFSYTFEIHHYLLKPSGRKTHLNLHQENTHAHKKTHHREKQQKITPRREPKSNFVAFLQNKEKLSEEYQQKQQDCFHFFNPRSSKDYHYEVQHWTNSIFEILDIISKSE